MHVTLACQAIVFECKLIYNVYNTFQCFVFLLPNILNITWQKFMILSLHHFTISILFSSGFIISAICSVLTIIVHMETIV